MESKIRFNIMFLVTLVAGLFLSLVAGDVYLHNVRGSNNRLNENTRPRKNANSLFDSQNNERGGYNVGEESMSYYQGSTIAIEWTNQHSCHNKNAHCEIILQYMCSKYVRDGKTTDTIPDNQGRCSKRDCNTDSKFRMNEQYEHYLHCSLRERNKGLFIADQNLNNRRNTARNTRQNPAGTRRGYECPEERDYFPYWHGSPWVDIAVLTNNVSRCAYFQKESQNVKDRWECVFSVKRMKEIVNKVVLPNNKQACEAFELPKHVKGSLRKPEWKKIPAHRMPPPECRETQYTRDNHLGNTVGGQPPSYQWAIPSNLEAKSCVFRIRYNISTSDYNAWDMDANVLTQTKLINMASKVGLGSEEEATRRGYILKTNPVTKIFDGINLDLRLAINTAQFGRTFQDRSHVFSVKKLPGNLKDAIIHNLNVRGKRGNIVQVYPAVEYDFVPNDFEIMKDDYIHVQWTGSNTNPANNAGQGKAGTDRNNVVLLASQVYPEGKGSDVSSYYYEPKYGHHGRNYPMKINNATFLSFSTKDALNLALLDPAKVRGKKNKGGELDDRSAYYNHPVRMTKTEGVYHYMCTRNNNFSNRDQKGRITVSGDYFSGKLLGYLGGTIWLPETDASLEVPEGVLDELTPVRLEQWSTHRAERRLLEAKKELPTGENYASDFYVIKPDHLIPDGKDAHVTFELPVKDNEGVDLIHIFVMTSSYSSNWTKVDATVQNGTARVTARQGGIYVARNITIIVNNGSGGGSGISTSLMAFVVAGIIVLRGVV